MRIFLTLMISIIFIFVGCSFNNELSKKMNIEEAGKDSNVITIEDSLNQVITYKNVEIDSLYSIIEELNFTVDSLAQSLEIANSRVAVNPDFQIPDSIIFAGRTFNLKNERIYSNFEKIYKQELRIAHKFIPRSGKYFTLFDSIFIKYDIPSDTKYLAIAESFLSPMAGSRVGAVGIWQFMPKTAKGFRMRMNSFIDERRNVFRSTEAAAKYLTE
ncbi:MAG: transglycosylase SLT domain-containing protein [Candidatus Cloacimonetes bacterium]|nr:transglycosylase SLT domain-containing protein [Candidatus Cloacimonadota bacterium]